MQLPAALETTRLNKRVINDGGLYGSKNSDPYPESIGNELSPSSSRTWLLFDVADLNQAGETRPAQTSQPVMLVFGYSKIRPVFPLLLIETCWRFIFKSALCTQGRVAKATPSV